MVRRIVRDAAYPILIGTVVGVVGASFATRIITTFLFQTAPTDPVTFAAVAVTLIVTGGIAALILRCVPRRSTRRLAFGPSDHARR